MDKILWTRIYCPDCPTELAEPSFRAHQTGAEVAKRFGAAFAIFHVEHGEGPNAAAGLLWRAQRLPAREQPRLAATAGDLPLEIWEEEGGRLERDGLAVFRAIATSADELALSAFDGEVDLLLLGTQRWVGAQLALAPAEAREAAGRMLERVLAVWPKR